jgi:enoyl-CoA hydratase
MNIRYSSKCANVRYPLGVFGGVYDLAKFGIAVRQIGGDDAPNSRMEENALGERMFVAIEKKNAVWTIILSRSERRNAVNGPCAAELAEAFKEFEASDEAKVAVLWGDGGTFCSGADLKAMGTEAQNRLEAAGDGPMGPSRMAFSKPVIVAISGYAVAGGLELALLGDLRVAEEDARLGVSCRRWGVPLIDGGTVRLPPLIGLGRALDLILTGRLVNAQEALQMGLVNRVVPKGQARNAAEALAVELANLPQMCMRSDRQSTYDQWGKSVSDGLAGEFDLGMETLRNSDVLENVQRFVDGEGRHGLSS